MYIIEDLFQSQFFSYILPASSEILYACYSLSTATSLEYCFYNRYYEKYEMFGSLTMFITVRTYVS